MNETPTRRTAKNKEVVAKARASMPVNSECLSNEVDESELQYEHMMNQKFQQDEKL
jgi:hypothetical protein